jgi:hypothetical protein
MKKILAKSLLVIIEAGIKVLAKRIKKKMRSSYHSRRLPFITLFADTNRDGTVEMGSLTR